MSTGTSALLEVDRLSVQFTTPSGKVTAVQDLSFAVAPGETLAILGESGSGKSVTARAIMGLLPPRTAKISSGRILFDGRDLHSLPPREFRKVLGAGVSMVFQDALTSLNPVVPVGTQIAELYRIHEGRNRSDAAAAAVEMMRAVRIPDAPRRARDYPFQFSGGMRQRVMIAMALALEPKLLIADEPTTALDVTVQAQILDLLVEVQRDRGMALMLITHDLGVAGQVAKQALVMYSGRLAEYGPMTELVDGPRHPYTAGLIGSIPGPEHKGQDLPTIPGMPPLLTNRPTGCPFHPRCGFATDLCREKMPEIASIGADHTSACHHWTEVRSLDRAAPVGP